MVRGGKMADKAERIRMLFQLMEYDALSDAQHDLIVSFEDQFKRRGVLSDRQFEILWDIYQRAAEK